MEQTWWDLYIKAKGYVLEKNDIEKQNGHPSVNGMKSICEQLLEAGL